MIRGFKYRLYPTTEQAATLMQWIGVCRLIYNVALHQRETQWRQYLANTGEHISFASQCRELTMAREQFDWIATGPRHMAEHALRSLDRAYQNFFSGRSAYPQPHRRGVHDVLSYRGYHGPVTKLNGKWSEVTVPKLGRIKFRDTRPRLGKVVNITITVNAGGWFASFSCERECAVATSASTAVGIDRGVANTLALSNGELLRVPASLEALERRQRRARRVLSRRTRGSNRYEKQRRRVARIYAKRSSIRRDWHHRVTTDIARRFGHVAVEALRVKNMTASGPSKRGLNRSILNQGWGVFTELLTYKLEERGGTLLTVDPAYTSQTCSECGTIDRESRKSQAVFHCRHCGFEAHADVNAAVNILRRSTPAKLVEVARWGADEARTIPNHSAELVA